MRRVTSLIALACLVPTSALHAYQTVEPGRETPSAPVAEIRLPGIVPPTNGANQERLSERGEWLSFRARHGDWRVWWNEATGTPHRAAGRPIPVAEVAGDAASIDRGVRAFVADHVELFGPVELETAAIQRIGHTWFARYRQLVEGSPVLLADWEFRVGEDGGLFLFGADAVRASRTARPRVLWTASAARTAAVHELSFDPVTDRILGGERLAWRPVPGAAGIELVPVYDLRVWTQSPRGSWAVRVDARSGQVVERRNLMCAAIAGDVSGTIHPTRPLEPAVSRPFAHLRVVVGTDTVATNLAGHYSSAASAGPISAGLYGSFCDVLRLDAPDAALTIPAPGSGTYDLAWSDANSHQAERDAYYHVTLAHDDVKRIDPALVRLDRPVVTEVNFSQTCNAFWDGYNIVFLREGTGCENSASTPTIVYHEYGHGIGYERYRQAANDTLVFPMNGMISEGTAEISSMFVSDEPVQGRDFYGLGTHVRFNGCEARWPDDQSLNVYSTMFIFTGAFWDLRLDSGKALAERIFHLAQYGIPDDPDDAVALSEYFIETLVADDDDSNLANGTPHIAAILRTFNPRGMGTRLFFTFGHVPLADQTGGGFPQVTATIQYAGPLGALAPGSPEVLYAVNQGPFVTLPMTPTGAPDEYRATLPVHGGALVRYYLRVRDTFGGVSTLPVGSPANRPFAFLLGTPTVLFADDMEISRGWSGVAPGDNATAISRWVRVDPNGTTFFDPIQPEDDHTPPFGSICWVTGNGTPGGNSNSADVDSGHTTLTSPPLDASGVVNPVIEYWRWYFNRGVREPETDYWRSYLSNDGGASWVPVENTTHTENRWTRILVRIQDYLTPTSNMRLRFVAQDSASNSTVEAAVDDVRLLGLVPTDVPDPGATVRELTLERVAPNPTSSLSRIEYAIPRAARVRLRILDVAGREVALPVDGPRPPGRHVAEWRGEHTAPGLYFVVLEMEGERRVQRVTRLR